MKCLSIFLALTPLAQAYYLPGVAPRPYTKGQPVAIWANELNSHLTAFTYEFYDFDFCPTEELKDELNLGQKLFGDKLEYTPYKAEFGVELECTELCTKTYSGDNKDESKKLLKIINAIKNEYHQHWIIDNLDVSFGFISADRLDKDTKTHFTHEFRLGFPLGIPKAYFNHFNITILYHTPETFHFEDPDVKLIVGAELSVDSIQNCKDRTNLVLKPPTKGSSQTINYSYEVHWVESDIPWASRWDSYLKVDEAQVRWLSIANSLVIVLFLSGMVAMILLRTVYRDIARYNRLPTDADDQDDVDIEETGWKLVNGDVFRTPRHPLLLSTLVGSGVQVVGMVLILLLFSFLHLLSPLRRGSIMTGAIVWFVCLGAPAGYTSARLYKMFGGEYWKMSTLCTSFLIPGSTFLLFLLNNIILWAEKSRNAVPFLAMLSVISLWFLISVPLTFFGSYLAYKKPKIESPVRVNQIPRQIPPLPFHMRPIPSIMIGGILPFGAIFIELLFLLSSLWGHRLYFLPFFLFIVYSILIIICGEVSVLLTYFQLSLEDYHWWWRSYLSSGATALYLFLYCTFYFHSSKGFNGFANAFLFFSYSTMMCIILFVMTGMVGFRVLDVSSSDSVRMYIQCSID
ncbi:hypothetical protein SARC_08855 [Sphaeroforma arctica JP610]|uniref:Transmembrane 9 superfamily member n=1 Tax=Sphaeroforma arctica JP610 TaxID=667725 RepID=A0A0L0FPT5_9EUKA|nr:hypothetical protein SARC_08855 [Sphaeroforma arctica JP610]KNC78724.1 hypothetical protein SARC_08855 [Sphaeroforma arctica JP610]|eukprot:XP_014152626.1 hypothetical protein SARC_08855 [Sphaeroforma arctica JP610]